MTEDQRTILSIVRRWIENREVQELDILQEIWQGDNAANRPVYTVGDMQMHGERLVREERERNANR